MKRGDLVKIRKKYYDELPFDIINDNKTYIIDNMDDTIILNAVLIIEVKEKTFHYMQERYLITLKEIKYIERRKKIKEILEQ